VAHGLSDLPSGITLRPVSSSDRDFLLQVYASTREEELARVPWTGAEKAAFIEQQFDAQDRHYREHYAGASLDVVECDGAPAGRLYVARWSDEIRIVDIALLPEFRGRGIGTRLLGELLDEAARSGKRVSIHVEKGNPAFRLYERLGFEVTADKGLYVLMEATP
jgi:ribosomal protein S18 acetylase RimI-like enzyme